MSLADSRAQREAREREDRRLAKAVQAAEREWHKEIAALMATGLSFDDAWVAAGGLIIDH